MAKFEVDFLWRKRAGTMCYHRRHIPKSMMSVLSGAFPNGEFFFSLGTADEVEAIRRNHIATPFTTTLLKRVMTGLAVPTRAEVNEFGDHLATFGEAPEPKPFRTRLTLSSAESVAWQWFQDVGKHLRTSTPQIEIEKSVSIWMSRYSNYDIDEGVADFIQESAIEILEDRNNEFNKTPEDVINIIGQAFDQPIDWWNFSSREKFRAALLRFTAELDKQDGKIAFPLGTPEQRQTATLSTIFEHWKTRKNPPRQKSINEAQRAIDLWRELTADPPAGVIDKKAISEFKKKLELLPDMRKSPYNNMSAIKALNHHENLIEEKRDYISATSIVKIIGMLRAISAHGVREGDIANNPFLNSIGKLSDKDVITSEAFSQDDMALFLSSPIFSGCAGKNPLQLRWKPGRLIIQDDMYWMALLAPYTGCRREEIGQLRVDDFSSEEGIPYFHLRSNGGRNLKTKSSHRIVPVHPVLERSGLLDFVKRRADEGASNLFQFTKNSSESLTSTIGSDLNDYLAGIGIKSARKTYRSFRTTVVSELGGIADDLRRAIVGHESGEKADVHLRYLKYKIAMRYEAIKTITYPVDPSDYITNHSAQRSALEP